MLADSFGYKVGKGNQGVYKEFGFILACMIWLQPSSSVWGTSPCLTRLSTSLNLELAPTQTLSQLRKLQLEKSTFRNVVQLAQLARPKKTVSPSITVGRWVISPAIAQTATWWRTYMSKLWSATMPQKTSLDAHVKTMKEEVHQPVDRGVASLPRRKRVHRWLTVRRRADWEISQTWTLLQEKAKEVSSCRCTSHKNTIMYGIIQQKGWQIGAR